MDHNMIDIHMHLVPGVDDGAQDVMMALSMLLRAKDQGITAVFATPHSSAYERMPEDVTQCRRQLQEQTDRFFPDISIYPGCEVYCDARSMDYTIGALREGKYPTMNGTRYVLMEFSQWAGEKNALPCVEAMVQAGYTPIIAHMERYQYLRENMEIVDRFRVLGAKIQINSYSLAEELEESVKNWARRLVLERKADFLGTDAHRTYHRSPSAEAGLNWLYSHVDAEYANAVARENARRLLIEREE